MTTVALIVAAGRSTRFGAPTPKTYAMLGGRHVLTHCIATYATHPAVDEIRVVIQPDHRAFYEQSIAHFVAQNSLLEPVAGGDERQDSVRLGLESLTSLSPELVIIHDAARPLVTHDLIDRILAPLSHENDPPAGSIAALPIADTVKRDDGGTATIREYSTVSETLERRGLWRAQTPQAFNFQMILAAHRSAKGRAMTDDSAIAEAAGLDVVLVPGDEDNLKITTADDLRRAERTLLAQLGDIRVGNGIDTHRFGPGDHVMLCGVPIPHEKGLQGHSDADVALHAVTDALLSTVNAGDIGSHFPPSDDRWRNAPSDVFASFAANKIRQHEGAIAYIDVTIVCETPRVSPYRSVMQERLASIVNVDPTRVSIKGTTTERLGFTGRGEGITAFAAVTVRLPSGGVPTESNGIGPVS